MPPFLHFEALDTKPMRQTGLSEWELDVLSRETLAYSSISGGRAVTSHSDVATLINLIKRLEENIWRAYPHGQRDIILELNRSSHRQFPWQRPTNHPAIARYYKIYSDPKVEEVLRRVTGLNTVELFRVGIGLTGHFLEKPALPIPAPAALRVDSSQIDNFLRRFADTIVNLRNHIEAKAAFGVNWAYVSNPLRDRPLVAVMINGGPHYLCPIPSFLLQRLTSGIYYELISDDGFANPFGASFQRYLGEVLVRVQANASVPYAIFPERNYGPASKRKDTVDWIATDGSANLFIEAKAKRLAVQAKIDLESRTAMESQVSKMAEFVVQVYKTIVDALDGKYPEWKPNALPIYPIVVTLEEWFPLGPIVHGTLKNRVVELMEEAKLDIGMLKTMPYSLASSDDFEMAIHVMSKRGIDTVMAERCSEEKREWLLAGVLTNSFADELSDAEMFFPEIWKEIIPETMGDQ
ncbi:MAG: hypothetical protein H7124_09135 [Phycisphaerales bacterium]|nr:hypothetical protein [Hyphomonadaceae bacterium]